MTTAPEELTLAAEFPAATAKQWRDLVRGVLTKSGVPDEKIPDNPDDRLATTTYDGITISPLYTAETPVPETGLPGLPPFTRGGRPEGGVATGWEIRARHGGADPAEVNQAVLADLENGVTALWLVVDSAERAAAVPAMLRDVLPDIAPITLDAGAHYAEAADALLRVFADRGVPASAVRGGLGIDPIGLAARTGGAPDLDRAIAFAVAKAREYPGLRTVTVDALPFHEAGGSDTEELGCAIAAGVAYLRTLTEAGLDVAAAARTIEFRLAVTADQFTGIAKLRAARRLWARVLEVSGVTAGIPQRQHAVTSTAMTTRRDPWVNMLRTTLACFAAGVGGADSVTVLPYDSALGTSTPFGRRVARNTQIILIEESHLAGVVDPAGGSWYVESLTDAVAHRAWDVFTEIERAGGIGAELGNGHIAERLAETWAKRSANIATRKDPITGVSEFPNLAEPALPAAPEKTAPEDTTSTGLPRIRYARAYEELRDRSDAALAETGRRPAVFLATIGPIARHTARATFAANLFQAGGIDTLNAGATDSPEAIAEAFRASGLRIACVCGTDKAYAEQGAEIVAALRAAGAQRVLLAGKRPDGFEVDDVIHLGCNALAVLRSTWEALEDQEERS